MTNKILGRLSSLDMDDPDRGISSTMEILWHRLPNDFPKYLTKALASEVYLRVSMVPPTTDRFGNYNNPQVTEKLLDESVEAIKKHLAWVV